MNESQDNWDLTPEQEDRIDYFFDAADCILSPERDTDEGISCFYWEDFSAALKFYEENPDVHIYTVLEVDGKGYIVNGARYVNRFAYLIAVNNPRIEDEIRIW